ncbi:NAD(P)-dependent oxidoreductase [Amycolatopsis aidingensis]|uniref:NAD(P)-dependent oxidoreductase n=1 Tax=Amycolatopsis aidingensis TaxID=2842453 RepID=UPI001C0CBD8D|nr:NAD(P)-dependent oxidoreductase [Amycolatopsis aidingensis]
MSHPDKPAVTVLGLGAMGTALAETLLAAGHPTAVWNRSPAKAEVLAEKGATPAGTAAEAIGASELVLVCLLDEASVREVLHPVGAALAGRTVANLTNGTPGQARKLAGRVREQGADYLDGGIMAVPPMIGTPQAFILYSGSRAAFDRHRQALDLLADSRFVGTEPGLAAVYDLALLGGMYGMTMGVLHAFALVRSAGVEPGAFAPLLNEWLGSMSGFVQETAGRVGTGDYATGVVSNLGMQSAGFGNHLIAAREQGISAELLAPLGPLMERRVAQGHGHEDLSSVIELLGKATTERSKTP